MAFEDNPQIDENSERSEESINAIKNILTRKNGFVCREEYPDTGIDLNVELVYQDENYRSVKSRKFPIQAKSCKTPNIIKKNGIEFLKPALLIKGG